jgi:hypothetical protein
MMVTSTFANPGNQGNGQNISNAGQGNTDGYLVSFRNNAAKEKVKNDKNNGKKVKDDFQSLIALAMDITEKEALELMKSTDVLHVEENGFVEILSIGQPDKNDKSLFCIYANPAK